MSRIIILSDIYDVRGTGGTKFRSHFLEEDERTDMYKSAFEDVNSEYGLEISVKNTNYVGGKYLGSSKYNFWTRYMGPYTVASNIREHTKYEAIVFDYFTKLDNFFDFFEQLVTPDTEYVALSLTFLNNPFNPTQGKFNLWHFSHEECCEWFKELKRRAPNAKIIIGGALVDTIYKQHFVTGKVNKSLPEAMKEYIDYAFHGYSERTMVDFLNGELDPSQMRIKDNVTFINEPALAGKGAIVTQTKWIPQDSVQTGEWLPLEISKGCRFGCKFCFYDHSGTVIKSAECLRRELLYNYEHFGTTGYQLTDDTVNDSMAKINMMHDVISSLPFKIEWIAYTRPDMFHKFPQMLDKMLDMGCRGMFLGVETFNHTAAKVAGKGLDPEKIKGILEWIREKAGDEIFILTSFIVGLPGETEESLMDTADWLVKQQVIDKAQYEILFVSDAGGRTSNAFSDKSDKFGIHEVRWDPEYYWRHGTMDLPKAKEIALRWESIMENHPRTQFERHADYNVSFWAYPRLRSFGLTHHEATDALCSGIVPDYVYKSNIEWIGKYHLGLIKHNDLTGNITYNTSWMYPTDGDHRNNQVPIKL
jgi:hypothetical protein